MASIQHILVALDFSESSRYALEYAELLARQFGAAIATDILGHGLPEHRLADLTLEGKIADDARCDDDSRPTEREISLLHALAPTDAAIALIQSGANSGARSDSIFSWPLRPAVRCTAASRHSGEKDMRTIDPRSG